MEKKLERLYLSKAKYVHFCRFFIYVFVVFEKENSGNINPWWGWFGLGHWKGGKACLGSVRSLRTASGLSASATTLITPTMGLLFSLPFAGVLGTVGSSCIAGLAFCFTSTAGLYFLSSRVVPFQPCYLEITASMFFKSCNCNSSIATRIGFAVRACYNVPYCPFSYSVSADICTELHACMAHEDPVHDRTH